MSASSSFVCIYLILLSATLHFSGLETVVCHRIRKNSKTRVHAIELVHSGFQHWLHSWLHSWQHLVEAEKPKAKTYPQRPTYAKRTVRYSGTGKNEEIREA